MATVMTSARRGRGTLARRKLTGRVFLALAVLATALGLVVLVTLLADIGRDGVPRLSWDFISSYPSRFAEQAGILSALAGTLWVMGLTAVMSIPIGVGTAIYLEFYAPRGRLTDIIQTNISNLAGVPSVVYGILGLTVFVRWFALDRSVLAGAMTMSLLILPIAIIASREALRAVPQSLITATYALGATKWQVVQQTVLPYAFPGILTGIILSMSRAIGETAPLIMMGALTYVAFVPGSDGIVQAPLDPFTVLPIQIFNWASRPQPEFLQAAAAGIVVLLIALLAMNSLAIYLRDRYQRKVQD